MVGVAGRSKGCATCRRRKLRCDLARPTCRRCHSSERICEGYRRYPVFIIKTTEGLNKRLPLSEVRVDPCAITLTSFSPTLGATVSNHAAQSQQFKSCFREAYLLANPSEKAWNSTSRWLRHVLEVPDPQPALHEALLAVAVIQSGKLNGSRALLIEGRRLYTRALRLLREALNDAVSVQHDDTLAAAGILILYERFDCEASNLDGWTSHMSGLTLLLRQRGARRQYTAGSKATFEYCRYLMMMQGLLQRRSVMLSESEWLSEPWKDEPKSIEQIVYDYGLRTAGLFEKVDMLSKSELNNAECLGVVRDCKNVLDKIERIIIDHIQQSGHTMPLLEIVALGIALGACISGCKAYVRLISNHEVAHIDGYTVSIGISLCYKQRDLAKAIVGSIKAYIAGRDDVVCNAKLMFSLEQALTQLSPDDVAFVECVNMKRKLRMGTWRFGDVVRSTSR